MRYELKSLVDYPTRHMNIMKYIDIIMIENMNNSFIVTYSTPFQNLLLRLPNELKNASFEKL